MISQVEMYDREHQARKTSLVDNVTDVFVHQNASSDPVVRSFDKQVKHCSHWEVAFFGSAAMTTKLPFSHCARAAGVWSTTRCPARAREECLL